MPTARSYREGDQYKVNVSGVETPTLNPAFQALVQAEQARLLQDKLQQEQYMQQYLAAQPRRAREEYEQPRAAMGASEGGRGEYSDPDEPMNIARKKLAMRALERQDERDALALAAEKQGPPMRMTTFGSGVNNYYTPDVGVMNAYQRKLYLPQGSSYEMNGMTPEEAERLARASRQPQQQADPARPQPFDPRDPHQVYAATAGRSPYAGPRA